MTQQREETAYRERLITSLQNIVIDRVLVLQIAQEADHAVYGYEQQYPDDVSLLVGFKVVCRVQEDEGEADQCGYASENRAQKEAEVVKGEAAPEGDLDDVALGAAIVADGHGVGLCE